MKIAQEKGLSAPHDVKPQDKATEDKLSKLSGDAFDRAYMATAPAAASACRRVTRLVWKCIGP